MPMPKGKKRLDSMYNGYDTLIQYCHCPFSALTKCHNHISDFCIFSSCVHVLVLLPELEAAVSKTHKLTPSAKSHHLRRIWNNSMSLYLSTAICSTGTRTSFVMPGPTR